LVDLAIVFFLLLIVFIIYQTVPSSNIIYLPVFLLIGVFSSLGVGIWLSALTIRYRDFQHIIPFMVQLGLYASPVAYPASLIPENLQLIYHLNPVAGVIEGFRWSLIGYGELNIYSIVSFGIGIAIFLTSLFYFKKVEKVMADIV
jgi:lipopolysaccharide transport system permease protein